MDSGLYITIFHLPRPYITTVGRLGRFDFAAGLYAYVGSAQKNLQARVARHARRHKPLKWHIDYLSVHAPMVGALLLPGGKDLECKVAAALAQHYPRFIAGFGASDCGCGGHLLHAAEPVRAG